jgi:hypothetical protein
MALSGIPIQVHGAAEVIAAPAIMAAPFLLGLDVAGTAVAVVFGVFLLALGLQAEGPGRELPVSAHAGFDYLLAAAAATVGIGIGIATGDWASTVFLAGIGAAQVALTAMTRFVAPRGA